MFRYSKLGSIALIAWSLFSSNSTQARVWYSGNSSNGSYEIEVIVHSVHLPVYHHGGHSYIEGVFGQRYVIRVHNHTWTRVEAVISVDGRDVLDGRPASLSKRGYIIPARSFIDVDGFRLNNYEVAEFRFTTVPDSYAARTGTPWDVGIIGVAFFPERVRRIPIRPRPPVILRDKSRRSSPDRWDEAEQAATTDSMKADTRGLYTHKNIKNMGTQFGQRRTSIVDKTSFTRQNWSYPAARLSVRYDDRRGLCSVGLAELCYPYYPPTPYHPPTQEDDYAQPPPGWEHFSPWY